MSLWSWIRSRFFGESSRPHSSPLELSHGQEPYVTGKDEELRLWSVVTGYEVIDVRSEGGRVMVLTTRFPYFISVVEILKRENGEA